MLNKYSHKLGLGEKGSKLLSTLSASGEEVYTIREAEAASKTKGPKLRKSLHDLAKGKWIEPIERGKYLILPLEAGPTANYGTHPYIIARKLTTPYYVGFASALNYYGITEQVNKEIYLATTKNKKPLTFHSETYRFVRLDVNRFFGIREEWIGNVKFNISEVEKTVVDCLYLPEYSGGLTEIIKAFKTELDLKKLYMYAVKMKDLATLKRLGFILDVLKINKEISEKLAEKVGGGYCLLDTNGPKTGTKNKKWRVIENIPLRELEVEA